MKAEGTTHTHRKLKYTLVTVARLVLGFFFVIFGFLRLNDPIGGAFRISSYIDNAGMDFFLPLAMVLAFFFAAIEFSIGVASILGTNIKSTTVYTIVLLLFLTPFTFYTAFFSPVPNDDSFGDVIYLSDKATFFVYLAVLLIAVLIYMWRDFNLRIFTRRTEWTIMPICMLFALLFSVWGYISLPALDFGAFRTGTDIRKFQANDTLKPADILPDSVHFLTQHHQRIHTRNGRTTAAIQLHEPNQGDVTAKILGRDGYTFLLVSQDLATASTSQRHAINDLYEYAHKHNYGFFCLTSSHLNGIDAEEYILESGLAEYPLINGDMQVLRTLIHSNPGLILLKDGIIQRKWSSYNIPALHKPIEQEPEAQLQTTSIKEEVWKIVSRFGLVLIIILAIDWIIGSIKWLLEFVVRLITRRPIPELKTKQKRRKEDDTETNSQQEAVTN